MKKVLVIEDNLEVRENIAEIVELANYEVIIADNGKSGVELAIKEIPDLVICDIMMPALDGYGVYHLLSKHKETASIPFIFLTAKSEKSDFRKGMQLGADDYITKPFEGIELLSAIETRLNKHELLKQQYSTPEALNELIENAKHSPKIQLTSGERDVFTYNRKNVLYKEGQRPRLVYHVISGKVKVSKSNDEGKEFITNIYGAGDFIGYASVLEDVNYTDQAVILEDATLMHIPREDFLQLISNDMEIAQTFIKIITRNVTDKEERLLDLAYNSLRKKVANGLIKLYDKYKLNEGAKAILNISREHLAQSIGIATETIIRTLSNFKDEKLIDIVTGKVIILDEKKLRNLVY
jgi:CRP/FNR family cyclic AMP-dependent transcriptional regulator